MRSYTDITVLLDRSGSMATIKESMETAFNTFIKEHKAVPSTKITLVQFDSINDQEIVYQCVPIMAAEKLTLNPRGSTPLVDAFVKVIDRTGERLAGMNEADRPDQVLMVIITDGAENASRKHKRHDVFDRVTKQRDVYKWGFVYLGANQDAIGEASSYGIPSMFAMAYAASDKGVTSASNSLIGTTVSYTSNILRNDTRSLEFNEKQRKDATDGANQ